MSTDIKAPLNEGKIKAAVNYFLAGGDKHNYKLFCKAVKFRPDMPVWREYLAAAHALRPDVVPSTMAVTDEDLDTMLGEDPKPEQVKVEPVKVEQVKVVEVQTSTKVDITKLDICMINDKGFKVPLTIKHFNGTRLILK